jgi:hypothetical protein
VIEVPPGTPLVTLADAVLADAVTSAAAHAAAGARVVTFTPAIAVGPTPADDDVEIVVVVCLTPVDERDVLRAAVEDGGRAIPVLGLATDETGRPSVIPASLDLLGDPSLRDLHVAVPAFDDDEARARVWGRLRDRQVEARHQLAEVGAGAWASLPPVGADPWASAGAFAAGILAGRVAAGNRRWRAQLRR